MRLLIFFTTISDNWKEMLTSFLEAIFFVNQAKALLKAPDEIAKGLLRIFDKVPDDVEIQIDPIISEPELEVPELTAIQKYRDKLLKANEEIAKEAGDGPNFGQAFMDALNEQFALIKDGAELTYDFVKDKVIEPLVKLWDSGWKKMEPPNFFSTCR